MAILNKYKRWVPQIKIILDEYWDFVLSQSTAPSCNIDGSLTTKCLSSYVNAEDSRCLGENGAVSSPDFFWDGYRTPESGATLHDIGFTGIDNGLFTYDKWTITNEDFYKILTESEYEIPEGDYRFKANAVSGNSQVFSYDLEYSPDGYYKMKGGFLQGFYKLDGFDYQVLPNRIENSWSLEFVIRPRDYEEATNTLNSTHADNKGFFFFMGARAENKFAQFYDSEIDKFPIRGWYPFSGDCADYMTGSYFEFDWDYSHEEYDKRKMNKLLLMAFLYANFSSKSDCKRCEHCENEYKRVIDSCSNYLHELGYYEPEASLSGLTITTVDGKPIENHGYFEIETDNKFLFFNRTKNGFMACKWNDEDAIVLTGITHNAKDNLFLIMHHGKNGRLACDMDNYYAESGNDISNKYNILKDLESNAFGIRMTDDGKIGYRYLVKDCNSEKGYSIIEEYSNEGIVKKDEWNVVNVTINVMDGSDACNVNRKMKLYFYVNGYLYLISKELPVFNFTRLNESYDKQEGVPYNISLGGGTQGLCDSIWLDFNKVFKWILPLEENFAGTFIGDFKSFKFYNCGMDINEIKNNYLYERKLWVK